MIYFYKFVHELGHLIGLEHFNENEDDNKYCYNVMCSNPMSSKPTKDDVKKFIEQKVNLKDKKEQKIKGAKGKHD